MKKNRPKIIIPILLICGIVLLVSGWFFYQLRNAVKLKASEEYQISEAVVLYRQDDALWAESHLGESKYTMESSGCLVSCIATAVTMNGTPISPGELNELFSANDVYDAEGNIQWECIEEIPGYNTEIFSEVSNDFVEKCLKEGHYPIVRVRMGGLGNFHYVLIVGTEDGEYICMDPLKDELTRLSDYGHRVYAIRCVWLEKPFYEYFQQDGKKQLSLYYNEQTKKGFGIRYYEYDSDVFSTTDMYTFTFWGVEEGQWDGLIDYHKQVSVDGGNGSASVEEYEENYEYDSEGKVTHFDSTGVLTFLAENNTEEQFVMKIDYEYYENGNLKHRAYWHNPWIFSSTSTTWESFFDEQGRVEYEDVYITHGSFEYYYIYSDSGSRPIYVLKLDNNLGSWIPEFTKY